MAIDSVPPVTVVSPLRPASLPLLDRTNVPESVLFRLNAPFRAPLRVRVLPEAALMSAAPVSVTVPLTVVLPLVRCSAP
ncbi:hypothetical protein D9M72_397650 [compost metagenome]